MNVKSTLFNFELEEEVYKEDPLSFTLMDEDMVCDLTKALHVLKQAPRA